MCRASGWIFEFIECAISFETWCCQKDNAVKHTTIICTEGHNYRTREVFLALSTSFSPSTKKYQVPSTKYQVPIHYRTGREKAPRGES